MNASLRRRACLAAAALPILLQLHGCAAVMLVGNTAALVKAFPSNVLKWVETNRLEVSEPADVVFAVVAQEVERNGRAIIERDVASHVLSVSYPFSWLKNNWGGTIRISCVASGNGTAVRVEGDGRDVVTHVRDIGDEILGDLDRALRRRPRTL